MYDQPKYKPLARSDFFPDERAGRPRVEGAVARGELRGDVRRDTGKNGTQLVTELPIPLTAETMRRGRERFEIFCAPCHDRSGEGWGMVVRRGYRPPPSFHVDRLRQIAIGHFFDVMTNGFGAMPDYASQIPVEDRWAIAAYIRALQYSQDAPLSEVPEERRADLAKRSPAGPLPVPGNQPGFPFNYRSERPKATRQ
jgi:mono/diheme cytochrome c family protein